MAVKLCSALLHYQTAVSLVLKVQMGGSFPMEVKSQPIRESYHTTELEYKILEHYFSIATLRVPQQGSSAVTYLLLMVQRASMWEYTLAPLVSALN